MGWSLALLAAAEVALLGWALSVRGLVLFAFGQLLLLALLAIVVLYRRYAGFRRAYELDIARRATEQQRAELAGELHDVLGHELSLIALRASALQVNSEGSRAEAAAQVRAQVEQAVTQLHQTMALLRPADPTSTATATTGSTAHDLSVLVERANAAGADVTLTGTLEDTVAAPIRLTAYRVAQEALTNATKHSPGEAVTIWLRSSLDALDISVETNHSRGATEDRETGSGLVDLRRRVAALGGELSVTRVNGRHITRAQLPLHPAAVTETEPVIAVSFARRPLPATLRAALLPTAVVTAVIIAFYSFASHNATLEQTDFEALTVGQPTNSTSTALPSRQALLRLTPTDPTPAGWACRYYTDGNFPLAMTSYEVCDDGTTLTRVTDLRRIPLR